MYKSSILYLFLLVVLLSSCSWNEEGCRDVPSLKEEPKSISIIRLDLEMEKLKTREEVATFMEKYPRFHEVYLDSRNFPPAFTQENIFRLISDPSVDTLHNAVSKYYKNLTWLEKGLSEMFARVQQYYPQYTPPKVYTVVTGFGTDIFYQDGILLIGLDYFMDSLKYRPSSLLPNYILRRRTPPHLLPSIALLVSQDFNEMDITDNTLTAEMIKWGKSHYFTSMVLPCVPDSLIIGYTTEEMIGIETNQNKVWEYYVKNKLFYSSESMAIKKYIEERPFSQEIDMKCPGRTGQWLGWRIIESYAKKEGKTLPEIMAETDSKSIFQKSKYKPKT